MDSKKVSEIRSTVFIVSHFIDKLQRIDFEFLVILFPDLFGGEAMIRRCLAPHERVAMATEQMLRSPADTILSSR